MDKKLNNIFKIIFSFLISVMLLSKKVEATRHLSLFKENGIEESMIIRLGSYVPRTMTSHCKLASYLQPEATPRQLYSTHDNNVIAAKTRMKLERAHKFEILLSDAENIKSEIFKLRYLMINEIVASSHYKDFYEEGSSRETDIYDIRSKFCALRINSRIVGTGRLILADKNNPANSFISQKFPEHFYKSFSYDHIPLENIAELSRQYVLPEYRKEGGFLAILKGRTYLCFQNNITHIFARMTQELFNKYKEYGLYYNQVSFPFTPPGYEMSVVTFTKIQSLLNRLHDFDNDIWNFVTQSGKWYPYQKGNKEVETF